MSLLECLVALALSTALLAPVLKTSAELVAKQIQYEKTQALISEGDRALELIGRAIRMAGYSNAQSHTVKNKKSNSQEFIQIQKKTGYRASDSFTVKHGLSDGVDFDCIGNILSVDRTKNQLALQGFLVERQAGIPKGAKVNGGSLMCQSLDRQGRIQNTTLMNGINQLSIEELHSQQGNTASGQRIYKVRLQMTDGRSLHLDMERSFATRNLL
jgi:hypothetical protein